MMVFVFNNAAGKHHYKIIFVNFFGLEKIISNAMSQLATASELVKIIF